MTTYLKPKQQYIDRYDRITVDKCRWWLSKTPEDAARITELAKKDNVSEAEAKHITDAADKLHIYFYTGERYIKKEETIGEWMQSDQARDQLLETATAPENITCLTCGRLMFVSSKHLDMGIEDKDRIMFFYDCPLNHLPRRAFYNTGEEFRRKKPVCPKCQTQVVEEDKDTQDKFITIITCPNCNHSETQEIKRTANKPEQPDPDYSKDREQFCLSEKDGLKFIAEKENFTQLAKFMDEQKEKEKHKDLYDKVAQLKKLKIVDLESLLTPALEKEGFIKLQFKNPEITKDVFVPFIVYEQRPDREEKTSTYALEKLLRKTLKETNWRLTSEGTNYRLGMIEGRLHGYEREEDMLKLVNSDEKKNKGTEGHI